MDIKTIERSLFQQVGINIALHKCILALSSKLPEGKDRNEVLALFKESLDENQKLMDLVHGTKTFEEGKR